MKLLSIEYIPGVEFEPLDVYKRQIYLYQRVLYKRGLFLLEGGFLTVKQPYNTTIYNTALYLRLSRDDELQGESGSIQTLSLIHISGKEKFAKREAPESDGSDRRCAGGISDLLYGNCSYFPDTNAAQSGCRYL